MLLLSRFGFSLNLVTFMVCVLLEIQETTRLLAVNASVQFIHLILVKICNLETMSRNEL